jgi:hypothetical protein
MVVHQSIILRHNADGDWLLTLTDWQAIDHVEIRVDAQFFAIHRGHSERLTTEVWQSAQNVIEAALSSRLKREIEPMALALPRNCTGSRWWPGLRYHRHLG